MRGRFRESEPSSVISAAQTRDAAPSPGSLTRSDLSPHAGRGFARRTAQNALILAALLAASLAPPAQAEDSIFIPLFTYRTGPFGASGIPLANGMHDYLTLLNERDGGIGGVKLEIEECETGYDTKRGVECYEAMKAKKPAVVVPSSTGITLQLIPKSSVDKIPVLSIGYGLSAAAAGSDFPWAFNPPATHLDGLSMILQYIGGREGGLDRLKGKTIGYIFLDGNYGREPMPLLQQFAQDYGFTVKAYPVAAPQAQNQAALWQAIGNDHPDWMIMWGFGAMDAAAVKEAAAIHFPMDRFIGSWHAGNEDDVQPAGVGAKGYLALNLNGVGADYPAIQEIVKHVVDTGNSQAAREKVGENLYDRGVYVGVLIAEAIRTAQRLSGRRAITGKDMRRGLESLSISAGRWAQLGLPDFASPITGISCGDHSGHQSGYVQQWTGTRWVRASGWIGPMTERLRPLLQAAAQDYVSRDPAWPKRTEPCDKSS
jgi:branched-chain amino acid transport system substrate-binding protein